MTMFCTNASGATWWPNLQLMQVAPPGGQICNRCNKRLLVTSFLINASGATWWPNLQIMKMKTSCRDYSRYGVNTLGPLCLWQCFTYCQYQGGPLLPNRMSFYTLYKRPLTPPTPSVLCNHDADFSRGLLKST